MNDRDKTEPRSPIGRARKKSKIPTPSNQNTSLAPAKFFFVKKLTANFITSLF